MVFARVGVKAKITEAKFLEEAMKMVLKKRNKLVNRLKLNSLVHGGADAITSFVTRLKPQARTGKFKEKCEACREAADYTDQMVLDNLIWGLADDDIKKNVLAIPEENCMLEKVLRFVQAEDLGKLILSDSKVAGLSESKLRQKVEGVPEL